MSEQAKKLVPVPDVSPIKAFHIIASVKLPWRISLSRQLTEFKPEKGEIFEVGEHMLIVRCGSRKVGIPWANVRYVEFA